MAVTIDSKRIAYLTEYDPVAVVESLPKPVFPVKMTIRCPPTREGDTSDETYSTPEYPVDIVEPTTRYVPSTTVHFDNPASRPPSSAKVWQAGEFTTAFTEQIGVLNEERSEDDPVAQLTSLTVVEVPQAYLTTDVERGSIAVKPDLYEDEAEITLAQFIRNASISATEIKSEIEGSIPKRSRALTHLTEFIEAVAKPTRYGKQTRSEPGRARYYTEPEAEKYNDLSVTPAVYRSDFIGGDSTRPLSPFIDELDAFLPSLFRNSDLIRTAVLSGEEQQETTFRAESIIE